MCQAVSSSCEHHGGLTQTEMPQPTARLGCAVWPVAPGLQTCTAHCCAKQHQTESSAGENDVIRRHGKYKMYEVATAIGVLFTAQCF